MQYYYYKYILLLLLLIICKHHYYSYFYLLHLNLALHTITHFAHTPRHHPPSLIRSKCSHTYNHRTASMNIYIHHWLTLGNIKNKRADDQVRSTIDPISQANAYNKVYCIQTFITLHSIHSISSIHSSIHRTNRKRR